jgi:acetyl esterase
MGRNRALYSRRLQQANERWPLTARIARFVFSHPDHLLSALGDRSPVEVEGRVLNRGTQALVALVNRVPPPPPPGSVDPAIMRARLSRTARLIMPIRTDVYVRGRTIPASNGGTSIPIRIYRRFGTGIGAGDRGGEQPPAIVYFHGGGWVTGDLDSHDSLCRLLAVASDCIVVSVDYRLAPEFPFPAAVDDALAAYEWVQRNSAEVGHREGRVGVMGDSAGGNLAAVVAMETRKGDAVPAPVGQGLIYPALDLRLTSGSARSMRQGFLLSTEQMEYFGGCYVPDPSSRENPLVSPLLAGDHRGLAPALVVTAGFDPLRDDGAGYAEAMEKAGVEVEYRCYDDQIHGFMNMGVLPDSFALATEVCDAMGRLIHRSVRAEA